MRVVSNQSAYLQRSIRIAEVFTKFNFALQARRLPSTSEKWGLPRCKNLTFFFVLELLFFLFYVVSRSFAVLFVLCFTSMVSFTGFYTEDEPKYLHVTLTSFCFLLFLSKQITGMFLYSGICSNSHRDWYRNNLNWYLFLKVHHVIVSFRIT